MVHCFLSGACACAVSKNNTEDTDLCDRQAVHRDLINC
jgi:hypothetical protein